MQTLTQIVLSLECSFCGNQPSYWCTSPKSGKKARYLHAARGDQVYAAWRFGYREGVKDGVVQTLHGQADALLRAGWITLARWTRGQAKEAEQVDPHA